MNNIQCPVCGHEGESICVMEVDSFPLIIDGVEMPLKIAVPVEHCQECNFQWTDHVAEGIRQKVYDIYYPEQKFKKREHDEKMQPEKSL